MFGFAKEVDIKDCSLEDLFQPESVPSPVGPIREAKQPIDLTLANKSCKSCYGTGIYGTLVKGEQRTKLVCRCVAKAMSKRS